jgi:hypothetical protein
MAAKRAVFSQFAWLKTGPAKRCCLIPGERRDGAQSRPPAIIRMLRNTPQGHIPLEKVTFGDDDASC